MPQITVLRYRLTYIYIRYIITKNIYIQKSFGQFPCAQSGMWDWHYMWHTKKYTRPPPLPSKHIFRGWHLMTCIQICSFFLLLLFQPRLVPPSMINGRCSDDGSDGSDGTTASKAMFHAKAPVTNVRRHPSAPRLKTPAIIGGYRRRDMAKVLCPMIKNTRLKYAYRVLPINGGASCLTMAYRYLTSAGRPKCVFLR